MIIGELWLVSLGWIGVAAVLAFGALLFGYYCALKQTINCADVTPADEPLFDREDSSDETMLLSADQIDQRTDWNDDDSE